MHKEHLAGGFGQNNINLSV